VPRIFATRRRLLLAAGALVLLIAAPVAVYAAQSHNFTGSAQRQYARWTAGPATISGTHWHNVPGLSITRCTVKEVAETVTLTVSGGPIRLRAVIDTVTEAPLKPGKLRFVPSGTESATFTFVGNTGPFEANDNHRFDIQWRSPTGRSIKLHGAVANLVFQRGTQACA
jgi:hypothetical protein